MSVKIYSRQDFFEIYGEKNSNGLKKAKSLNILNYLFPQHTSLSTSTTTDNPALTHGKVISSRRNKNFYSSSSSSGGEDKISSKKLKLRSNKSLDDNDFFNPAEGSKGIRSISPPPFVQPNDFYRQLSSRQHSKSFNSLFTSCYSKNKSKFPQQSSNVPTLRHHHLSTNQILRHSKSQPDLTVKKHRPLKSSRRVYDDDDCEMLDRSNMEIMEAEVRRLKRENKRIQKRNKKIREKIERELRRLKFVSPEFTFKNEEDMDDSLDDDDDEDEQFDQDENISRPMSTTNVMSTSSSCSDLSCMDDFDLDDESGGFISDSSGIRGGSSRCVRKNPTSERTIINSSVQSKLHHLSNLNIRNININQALTSSLKSIEGNRELLLDFPKHHQHQHSFQHHHHHHQRNNTDINRSFGSGGKKQICKFNSAPLPLQPRPSTSASVHHAQQQAHSSLSQQSHQRQLIPVSKHVSFDSYHNRNSNNNGDTNRRTVGQFKNGQESTRSGQDSTTSSSASSSFRFFYFYTSSFNFCCGNNGNGNNGNGNGNGYYYGHNGNSKKKPELPLPNEEKLLTLCSPPEDYDDGDQMEVDVPLSQSASMKELRIRRELEKMRLLNMEMEVLRKNYYSHKRRIPNGFQQQEQVIGGLHFPKKTSKMVHQQQQRQQHQTQALVHTTSTGLIGVTGLVQGHIQVKKMKSTQTDSFIRANNGPPPYLNLSPRNSFYSSKTKNRMISQGAQTNNGIVAKLLEKPKKIMPTTSSKKKQISITHHHHVHHIHHLCKSREPGSITTICQCQCHKSQNLKKKKKMTKMQPRKAPTSRQSSTEVKLIEKRRANVTHFSDVQIPSTSIGIGGGDKRVLGMNGNDYMIMSRSLEEEAFVQRYKVIPSDQFSESEPEAELQHLNEDDDEDDHMDMDDQEQEIFEQDTGDLVQGAIEPYKDFEILEEADEVEEADENEFHEGILAKHFFKATENLAASTIEGDDESDRKCCCCCCCCSCCCDYSCSHTNGSNGSNLCNCPTAYTATSSQGDSDRVKICSICNKLKKEKNRMCFYSDDEYEKYSKDLRLDSDEEDRTSYTEDDNSALDLNAHMMDLDKMEIILPPEDFQDTSITMRQMVSPPAQALAPVVPLPVKKKVQIINPNFNMIDKFFHLNCTCSREQNFWVCMNFYEFRNSEFGSDFPSLLENNLNWIYIDEFDELRTWGIRDRDSYEFENETEFWKLKRVDSNSSSNSSTCSEHEKIFERNFMALTHRMVHRKASAEIYRRILDNSLEVNKRIKLVKKKKKNKRKSILKKDPNLPVLSSSDSDSENPDEEEEYGFRIHGSRPVVISAIEPNSLAEKSGLEVGDVIIKLNGHDVLNSSHSEVVKLATANLRGKENLDEKKKKKIARRFELNLELASTWKDCFSNQIMTRDERVKHVNEGVIWKFYTDGRCSRWLKRFGILNFDDGKFQIYKISKFDEVGERKKLTLLGIIPMKNIVDFKVLDDGDSVENLDFFDEGTGDEDYEPKLAVMGSEEEVGEVEEEGGQIVEKFKKFEITFLGKNGNSQVIFGIKADTYWEYEGWKKSFEDILTLNQNERNLQPSFGELNADEKRKIEQFQYYQIHYGVEINYDFESEINFEGYLYRLVILGESDENDLRIENSGHFHYEISHSGSKSTCTIDHLKSSLCSLKVDQEKFNLDLIDEEDKGKKLVWIKRYCRITKSSDGCSINFYLNDNLLYTLRLRQRHFSCSAAKLVAANRKPTKDIDERKRAAAGVQISSSSSSSYKLQLKESQFLLFPFEITSKSTQNQNKNLIPFYCLLATESDFDRKRWLAALEYNIDRWMKI